MYAGHGGSGSKLRKGLVLDKILIVGHPHGATSYIANLLQSFGLDVRHEDPAGKDGVASWLYAVDDGWREGSVHKGGWVYYRRGKTGNYFPILHQVRDPLNAIRSISVSPKWTQKFRARHIPIDMNKPLVSGIISWVEWHKLCDKISQWTYRVEDLGNPETWKIFKDLCGLSIDSEFPEHLNKKINSKRSGKWELQDHPERWSWKNLSFINCEWAIKAYELARKYGYKYDDGP